EIVDQPLLRIGKEQQRKTETDVQIQVPKELSYKRLDCKSWLTNKRRIICNSDFLVAPPQTKPPLITLRISLKGLNTFRSSSLTYSLVTAVVRVGPQIFAFFFCALDHCIALKRGLLCEHWFLYVS